MKYPKNRFQVGDTIAQIRLNEVIKKGHVTNGPVRIDGIDHYNVEWTWFDNEYKPLSAQLNAMWGTPKQSDLVCDLPSKKYDLMRWDQTNDMMSRREFLLYMMGR
jgi:hypothetical protein